MAVVVAVTGFLVVVAVIVTEAEPSDGRRLRDAPKRGRNRGAQGSAIGVTRCVAPREVHGERDGRLECRVLREQGEHGETRCGERPIEWALIVVGHERGLSSNGVGDRESAQVRRAPPGPEAVQAAAAAAFGGVARRGGRVRVGAGPRFVPTPRMCFVPRRTEVDHVGVRRVVACLVDTTPAIAAGAPIFMVRGGLPPCVLVVGG
mmetsp:Transcript_10489/g.32566  ORF Transcript_10489/g.32566 Transcript_10489/m.32566 type:complete len:205 (+) Transcript_10489:2960-3574(+)